MRFWWVNHKQTFKSELGGGYIWSPTKNKNGAFNQGYENMTLTKVGDIIFSYSDTKIKAIGVIKTICQRASVPVEFGTTGDQWNNDGYLVEVNWDTLEFPFSPKLHIDQIKNLLPSKYSPIQKTGNGNQAIYLAEISAALADKLIELINKENDYLKPDIEELSTVVADDQEQKNIERSSISVTEKNQLIKARVGQGIFKSEVRKIEKGCRITQVVDIRFLIASHIKPWCKSTNAEKLDGNNGLLLSPHIDKLFDKGWISFSDDGDLLVAKTTPTHLLKEWKIETTNVGTFNKKQKIYLEYHRSKRFKDNSIR